MDEVTIFLRNAEKILFAEDFVYYVMLKNAHVEILPYRVEELRYLIRNAFNETTKEVIQFLERTMQFNDIFKKLRDDNGANIYTFERYALVLRREFFSEGFNARNFLFYCTNLANLAAYFYAYQVPDITSSAILNIVIALDGCRMSPDKWDTLGRTAARIVAMAPELCGLMSIERSVLH